MLPYPSGEPHVGHLKNYAVGDAVAHFRRRTGHRVLHPMGYDAFGLPAENNAIKTGKPPREATERSIAAYRRAFRAWGISIDWSREIASHEPELLPLDAMDLPAAVRARSRPPQGVRGQLVSPRPDGARQRAGDRRPLRALWPRGRAGASSSSGSSGSPRTPTGCSTIWTRWSWPERVKSQQRNWIGRVDGCGGDVPLRGARRSTTRCSHPSRHAVRRHVLRDGARASRCAAAARRAPRRRRRCARTSTAR